MAQLPSILTLALLAILTASKSAEVRYPTKISSGFYEEELPTPSYYETVYPLVFSFAYPIWNNLDLTLRDWRGKCTTDKFAPSYSCVVFYYYERTIERLQYEIVQHNVKTFAGPTPGKVNPKLDKCDEIQKHFDTMMTSQESVDAHFEDLKSCPQSYLLKYDNITDYVYNIKTTYSKMLQRFEAEFSSKFDIVTGQVDNRFGPASYVNNLLADQSLMLSHYVLENDRWENAFKACALQVLPTTLVKAANLTAALHKISTDIQKDGFELTIPAEELSRYLMYPITDCTFTDAKQFIVRLLVPIRRKVFVPKLVKLQPIPFLLNTEAFGADPEKGDLSICVNTELDGTYIWEQTSQYLTETDCEPGVHLCPLQSRARIYSPHLCPPAYFARNLYDFRKHCYFECERFVDTAILKLPIFRRMASNVYTVTGTEDHQVFVKCGETVKEYVYLPRLGALEIHLPCGCTLNYQSQVFSPESPCPKTKNVTIINLIPSNFFKHYFVEDNGGYVEIEGNFTKDVLNPTRFVDPDSDLADSGASSSAEEHVIRISSESGLKTQDILMWIVIAIQSMVLIGLVGFLYKRAGLFNSIKPSRSAGVKRMRFHNANETGNSSEYIAEHM